MEKNERLKEAFIYLKNQGKVHTQADVAKKMNATAPNISAALKGEKKVITDSFLKRFNSAFDEVFNLDWLMTGEGEMLTCNAVTGNNNTVGNINSTDALLHAIDEIAAQRKMVEKSQQQIDKLLQQQQLLIETIAKKT